MGKISERQGEKYKIWTMAILVTGACLSLYYFHVILRIGTIVTHLFYVPIILASIWWKRKGLVVALFSSGFLIFSHVVLRPDVAIHNDYFRAFMFIVTAFVVAELSRRIAKEHEALQAANQQLSADEQQLRAANQQLRANEQQLVSEITERKKAEGELQETTRFLETIFDTTHVLIAHMDPQFNFIKVNRAYALADEKEPSFFPGKNHFDLYPNEENEAIFRRVVETAEPYFADAKTFEYAEHPERGVSYWDWSLIPIKNQNNGVTGLVLSIINVTERKLAEKALRESEERYRALFEEARDAIMLADTETALIVDCNRAASEMLERNKSELIGQHQRIIHPPSSVKDGFSVSYKKHLEESEGQVLEEQVVTGSGKIKDVAIKANLLYLGERKLIQGIFRDITEKKLDQEALKESEEKFRSLAEQSPNMIFINRKGKVVYANKKCEEKMGYKREEFYSPDFDFLTLVAPESVDLVKDIIKRRSKGEDIKPYEYTLITKTGKRIESINSSKLVQYEGQKAILGVVTDITERKKAEEALRESENRYKAVVDNAIEGIVVVQDGMLKFVNPKLISLVGYSVKELMSRPFIEFIHSDDRERVMGIHIKRLKGEEVPRINEFKVIDKKGNTIWVENNGILIEWSGRPATLNFLRDITERKKVQEALKYRIEFERLITMLSKRFIDPGDIDEKINQALKAIGEFAKVDRAYIFQLRDDNRTVDNTHEWRAEGIEPQIENLKGITLDDELPWFWEKMKAHETFHVPVVADLPPEAHLEKKHFERQGIQALVVVPMINKGVLKGFLGFDSVRSQKTWAEDIITLLIISGENISMALERERAEQRARLLSSTVEQSSEGMGVIDLQGNLLFLNNAFAAMHGYTPEELIGRHVSVFHTPEQVPSVEAANRQTKETGEFNGEIWHVRLDGEVFPGLMHNSLLRNEKGEPVGMIGTLRDITESKRAEQALKESEMKFRSLTEDSLVGVYLIQDGVFKYVNPKFAETFGYTPDELIDTKGPDKIIFSEDWPTSKENLRRRLEGELKSIQYGFRGVTKDKKIIYVEVYGSATQYQGRPAVIGTLLDITERRRADEALQESELKFKTIFENAGGAIFIGDRKTGEILECNTQAEMLLGCTRAEIIGMHQSEVHPWGEEEKYKKRFAAHVQKGHAVDYEGEVQHRDGRRIPVWITAQSLKIGGKDVILGLFMNITERKKAEEKLIENRAKLKSLASQLSLIEERERHRLATELHDQISQSLVMSKMKLDSLRYSISSSESAEVLEEVSDYLGQIIQDTRTLTFDLSSPILYELGFEAAVAEWLDEQIREKHGIKTEFEDDGQPKPLDDDIRMLLFRNVRELLINVVKHANAKNVKVSIWKMDKNICVRVEDDGVGFDVTEVESMVTKKAKFGLFSIQERLESVGGHFEIKSKVGQGSKITMTAPLNYKKITDGA